MALVRDVIAPQNEAISEFTEFVKRSRKSWISASIALWRLIFSAVSVIAFWSQQLKFLTEHLKEKWQMSVN